MPNRTSAAVSCLFLVLALLLAYPLARAFPTGDDFAYLTLGAQLDNPLLLLAQDSTASYFFRPVVMLLWWVTSAITREPAVHYAINIGLHALNGGLIVVLLRRMGISPVPAVLAGVVFVAHTTAVAAAMWLSVRFDLVCLAFGLASLIALRARRPVALALFTLACVLSKETGYALAGTALVAAVLGMGGTDRRTRTVLAATIGACIVAALLLRWYVLRAVIEASFLPGGTFHTLWAGLGKWFGDLGGYLVVRQGTASTPWLWGAALAILALLACLPGTRPELRKPVVIHVALMGLAIALLAAAVQSPVVNTTQMRTFAPGDFDFFSVTVSRLYYVPIAGLCIAAAALGEAIARANLASWMKQAAVGALAIAAVGLVAQSRYVGRQVASFTARTGPVYLEAALDAIRPNAAAAPGCKMFFLGMPPEAEYIRMFLQAAAMQRLPRDHPATRCFLLTEHAPWYNVLQNAGLPPDAQAPLETMRVGGKPFQPLRLGNLTYYFLVVPDLDAVREDPNALFFAWNQGRFVDVTADVRSHRRSVHFIDNR